MNKVVTAILLFSLFLITSASGAIAQEESLKIPKEIEYALRYGTAEEKNAAIEKLFWQPLIEKAIDFLMQKDERGNRNRAQSNSQMTRLSDDSENESSCLPNEIIYPVDDSEIVKKIIIERDPITGKITIRIVFYGWLVPDFVYRFVCVEEETDGVVRTVCRLQNAFGFTMCEFIRDHGSRSVRIKCDSDILDTVSDCRVEEREVEEDGRTKTKVCLHCDYLKTGRKEWRNTDSCKDPEDIEDAMPTKAKELIKKFLPRWFPELPEIFPSFFPAEQTKDDKDSELECSVLSGFVSNGNISAN